MSQQIHVAIIDEDSSAQDYLAALANQFSMPLVADADGGDYEFRLRLRDDKLYLIYHQLEETIDFVTGKARHRRLYGGGKSQLIAKACGLKHLKSPTILDLTAGYARDAFTLASLGCEVTMVERDNVLAALLYDGLRRLQESAELSELHLRLVHQEAEAYLSNLKENEFSDIIYLDPMFPSREKSAKVKKDMQILHALLNNEKSADHLLPIALTKARKRVVVKRPRIAPHLNNQEPDIAYIGKSSRYDVYLARVNVE